MGSCVWGKSGGLPLAFLWPSCGLLVAFLWPFLWPFAVSIAVFIAVSNPCLALFRKNPISCLGKNLFVSNGVVAIWCASLSVVVTIDVLGKTQCFVGKKKPF